jgi:hypothetical protein
MASLPTTRDSSWRFARRGLGEADLFLRTVQIGAALRRQKRPQLFSGVVPLVVCVLDRLLEARRIVLYGFLLERRQAIRLSKEANVPF